MIVFSHVYKTYDGTVHALSDVQMTVDKGEFVFLKGPSGSGKTSLFNLLCAYDRASSGQIKVMGSDIGMLRSEHVPLYRRKIGVVFQDYRLLKDRTVFENVALPLEIRGDRKSAIVKRVSEVLDQVSLLFKKDRYPSQLSGGEQQRVSIARALVHQPGLLIADEPTGNLDPTLSQEIMDLLTKVNSQGTTVFVATHDHSLVHRRARRVIELENGRIVAST